MHEEGRKIVQYIVGLKDEFSKGIGLTKTEEDQKPDNPKAITNFVKEITIDSIIPPSKKGDLKINTGTINITEKFQCKPQEFYNAMTRSEMVQAFTKAPVNIDPSVGGKFELFNGYVTGIFTELNPPKKIVQRWRCNSWPDEHFSTVKINIYAKNEFTEIIVTQSGVPKHEILTTKRNWERNYWNAMKRTFGFGAFVAPKRKH